MLPHFFLVRCIRKHAQQAHLCKRPSIAMAKAPVSTRLAQAKAIKGIRIAGPLQGQRVMALLEAEANIAWCTPCSARRLCAQLHVQ